jgi:two-component system LytT family response regulator
MSDSTKIRAVVVDDEALARERIQSLLATHPDVEVVGACADGPSAIETIEKASPNLVFLDVQMPGMDGFEVVANIDVQQMPAIVFVTAHDGHALRAFEIHALDFLLKPFDETRFNKALEHARGQIAKQNGPGTRFAPRCRCSRSLRGERKYNERLIVKSGGRVFFVRTEEIDWVEAAGNYVKIHTKSESHLPAREHEEHGGQARSQDLRAHPSLGDREHRRIKELEPWFHGEYIVIMRDGTRSDGEPGVQRSAECVDRVVRVRVRVRVRDAGAGSGRGEGG